MKKYYFLVLGLMLAASANSQSIKSYVITSTGSSLMSSEGALYISIGEPMSTEISDEEIMISQGFLNVSIAGITVSTDDLLTETIKVFPNPTVAEIVVDMPEMDGAYSYQLTDVTGQLMRSETLSSNKTTIGMQNLTSGVYYMKVVKEGKQSRTLKIIKL